MLEKKAQTTRRKTTKTTKPGAMLEKKARSTRRKAPILEEVQPVASEPTLQDQEYYAVLVQLVIHAENVLWTRFCAFTVASTLLILAWVLVYMPAGRVPCRGLLLCFLSALGAVSGVCLARLGCRGKKRCELLADQAWRLENQGEATDLTPRPFTEANIRLKAWRCYRSVIPSNKTSRVSGFLSRLGTPELMAVTGPLLYTLLFIALFVFSFLR